MRKSSKPITRSDLVDLVQQIHASLKPEFAKINNEFAKINNEFVKINGEFAKINGEFTKVDSKFGIIDKRLTALETSNKKIILSLDRMEKKNGHLKTSLHKVARVLHDV